MSLVKFVNFHLDVGLTPYFDSLQIISKTQIPIFLLLGLSADVANAKCIMKGLHHTKNFMALLTIMVK